MVLLAITVAGCCRRIDSDPPRAQARGWGQLREGGVTSAGEFLLTKGSVVEYPKENARVGIELKEVIQGTTCRGTESRGPQAVVRFYNVANKQTITELTITEGSTRLISFFPALAEEYGLDTLSLKAINTKDGWIWLDILE